MLHFPHTRNEWVVAVVSALVGFFVGGAAVALVQMLLKRLFGLSS